MRLAVSDLAVRIGKDQIISDADFTAESGEIVALVGPNGSGKSTMLKTLYRAIPPSSGTIWLGDRSALDLPARQVAKHVAALAQEHTGDFPLLVREIVGMGLIPHKGALQPDTAHDRALVSTYMGLVDVGHLADRPFASLSGGEKQRTLLASALAQRPQVLVLDELTNHLDIAAQLSLLDRVRALGVTVIVALHDLNLAAAYCDRIYVVQHGRIVAGGTSTDVLRSPRIADVFGVDIHIGAHPVTGALHLFFTLPQPQPQPSEEHP